MSHYEAIDELIERAADLELSNRQLLKDLVKFRKDHGVNQDEVADRMGVTQPTVSGFEHYDANPTLATIRRYALAIGAHIEHRVVDKCHRGVDERFKGMVESFNVSQASPTRPATERPKSTYAIRNLDREQNQVSSV